MDTLIAMFATSKYSEQIIFSIHKEVLLEIIESLVDVFHYRITFGKDFKSARGNELQFVIEEEHIIVMVTLNPYGYANCNHRMMIL